MSLTWNQLLKIIDKIPEESRNDSCIIMDEDGGYYYEPTEIIKTDEDLYYDYEGFFSIENLKNQGLDEEEIEEMTKDALYKINKNTYIINI